MKKLICLLMAVVLLLSLSGCSRNNTDIAVYEKFAAEDKIMPELEELGEYVSVKSLYHHGMMLFFEWEAYNLIVAYREEDYESAKANAQEKYTFETEDITGEPGIWEDVSLSPSFTFEGYQMNLLKQGESYSDRFPKLAYFAGFNDETHKIAYVYFRDPDLDAVESLEGFLMDECGWSVLIQKNIVIESETPFRSEGRC